MIAATQSGVGAPSRTSRAAFQRDKQSKQNSSKLVGIGATSPLGQGGGKDQGDQLNPVICDVVTGTAPSSPLEARFAIMRQP